MNKASIVIPLVGAALLALAGCSSDDASGSSAATEEGLRSALDAQYEHFRSGDFAADYDSLSQRCQDQFDRAEYAQAASTAYAGRDFSGPQEVAITMDGESATVVVTSFDGKGNKEPMTWAFIDGQWKFDNC